MNIFNSIYLYIKKYVLNNRLFLSYITLSVLMGILLHILTLGWHVRLQAIFTDLLFVLFIGSFGYLFKPKSRFIYYFSFLAFFTALVIANTIYFQFYQSFISINLLATASMIGGVNDSLWAKLKLIQFVYLFFPILFIIINNKLKKINYYELLESHESKRTSLKRIVIFSFFLLTTILLSVSFNNARRFVNQWNKEYIVNKYGIYLYTINDLVQNVDLNLSYEYENAVINYRNYYSCKWERETTNNEYTDRLKDKNVLFIHAESIQNFLIGLEINGKEVTPNINKFAKEGMYFSKFYPQISVGTSSDTEFTLLTGLMPSSKGTVFVNYYDNTYYGMPEYFKKLGYYTFSMHANDAEYWNRKVMHESLGYDYFYAKDSFYTPIDQEDPDYIGLGLSDKAFFKQAIPLLKNIKENNSPYFGTIITLTNHSPFNDIEKYGDFDISIKYSFTDRKGVKHIEYSDVLEDTTLGNYLKSAHYADEAFGLLINKLKNENMLDNTIIVFYGDHEARIPKNDFDLFYNFNKESDDPDYIDMDGYNYELMKNTPFIIWSNEETYNQEITETMGMYDVLPTIANLFGFEEKYSLGHDIFSNEENIVVFPNGNVLTDKVYYSNLYEEYIAFTDDPIDTDYITRISEYSNDILEVSNGIIYHDLIFNEGEKVGICNEKEK